MEVERFIGRYVRVTTEEKAGQVFERVYARNGICVIPVTVHGKIRMINEETWDRPGQPRLKLVSGYIEDGESPECCARRELEQEICLTAENMYQFLCSESKGAYNKCQYYFVATGLHEGTANPDQGEKIHGFVDLEYEDVHRRAISGEFGTTSTAFALIQFTARLPSS